MVMTPRITMLGVPFDSTVSYRPGARFAPPAIRSALDNIEFYSVELGVSLEDMDLDDAGDVSYTQDLAEVLNETERLVNKIKSGGGVPCVLGGEHTITLASYKPFSNESVLVVFDAHLDLREELYGLRLSHATFMRRLIESHKPREVFYVGVRAAVSEEWEYAYSRSDLNVFKVTETDRVARELSKLGSRGERVYISVDLDVADPAYAPGVSCPEPGGLTSRELLALLASLRGVEVVGFDVVELCPPQDQSNITSVLAAKLVLTLSGLVTVRK